MAVIGKIREQSTLVLIIIGGAIMAFVLGDLFSSGGSVFNQTRDLAVVNDQRISVQEFETRVQNAYENYQLNSQSEEPLDERTKSSIREQVWNDMLLEIILGEEMEELGLSVTTGELFDMVQGENPHPQIRQAFTNPETGQFNSSDVVRFLQNLDQDPKVKEQWISFERSLKKNHLRDKYNNLVKKGLYFTDAEGEISFKDANRKMSLQFVMKPYSSVADENIQITDEELRSYYKEHKKEYEQSATRKIRYAYFPVGPSETDQEFAEKWTYETYDKFLTVEDDSGFVNTNSDYPMDYQYYSIDNFPEGYDLSLDTAEVGTILPPKLTGNVWRVQKLRNVKMAPDSVQARHILINTTDRSPEEAHEIADSLQNLLEQGGDFGEIALENSDDVASAQNGGDVGWFTEGVMVKPFNDAAFSSEVGEIKRVETQFGVHLIEVTDKTDLKKKYQVAVIERVVEPSSETYANIFNRANSFSINVNSKESFDSEIEKGNIIKREAVIGEKDIEVPGMQSSRDLIRWVNEADEGDVSEAYDVDDAFVVAYVEEVNKKGIAPFEKVRSTIEMEVRKEKKAEVLKSEMTGTQDLQTLANKLDVQVRNASNVSMNNPQLGNTFEPKVVGKISSLEQGQLSVPISGKSGVYVVQVVSVDMPADINVQSGKRILAQNYRMRIDNNTIFNSLKEKAEIEDNRIIFY